ADLDWFLYHESNLSSWVARGYTVNNPEAGSYNATATGRYYLWVDGYNGATSGYTLSVSGGLAKFTNSGPEKSDRIIPEVFSLGQNYPNPFNPTTSIQVAVPEKALVTLEIYDITGRKIQTLLNDEQEPGVYTVSWDGTNQFGEKVSSGIYFYRMAAGKFIQTRRMMLLK
ncbi:MAG: T9SS type A sorting domain-containing protein, partial [Calditrichaeota bacterium]|nr:T9SS type A sorting domain-containing protein [Calditrichota bacterium]